LRVKNAFNQLDKENLGRYIIDQIYRERREGLERS